MKNKLLLGLSTMALFACSAFGFQKPVQALAEDSQETSVVEQSSEEPKKFNVDEVVIDGKTIEQWKNELKDENTRSAAIIGIVMFAAGGFLFVVKWLVEHKVIKNAGALAALTSADLEKQRALLEEKAKELGEAYVKLQELADKVEAKADEYVAESVYAREMLEIIMKTDPTLVANGAWAKAEKMLEEKKHGEKE